MIRPYKSEDTDALITLWRAASAVAHPFLTPEFLDQEAENMRNIYLVHAETWVREQNGSPVGFIALINTDGGTEVGGLFVDPDYHKLGFGRALVDHARTLKGTLDVEVFERNSIGRRFYARCGFVETDRSFHDASKQTTLRLRYATT